MIFYREWNIALFALALFTTLGFSQPVQLANAFPNLTFAQPIYLTQSNDETNRVFVIQKNGVIRVFPNDSTVTAAPTFLNLSSRIITGGGGDERGLLGLAFGGNIVRGDPNSRGTLGAVRRS